MSSSTVLPKMPLLLLGAVGPVRDKSRLWKYAFLADKLVFKKDRQYRWRYENGEPRSNSLEKDIEAYVKDGCVEVKIDGDQDQISTYSLTINGSGQFLAAIDMYSPYAQLVSKMRSLLLDYQLQNTQYHLIDFLYEKYPECAYVVPSVDDSSPGPVVK